MYVCICAAVTDSQARDGLSKMSLREFKDKTGACKQCCKCHESLKEIKDSISIPNG